MVSAVENSDILHIFFSSNNDLLWNLIGIAIYSCNCLELKLSSLYNVQVTGPELNNAGLTSYQYESNNIHYDFA